jgi:hypothetical protein
VEVEGTYLIAAVGTDNMYDTDLSYVNSVTVRLPSGGVRTRLN